MRIKLVLILSLLLFSHAQAAKNTCVVSYVEDAHQDVLKAILTRVILDAKEFDDVKFLKAHANLTEHDLAIKKDGSSSALSIVARLRFSNGYPATWEHIEKLNGHLTPPVLTHLSELHLEKNKSLPDVADIFIGSLNWKRIEEEKPAPTTLEPASSNRTSFAPRLQWGRLIMEQLPLIFGPLAIGLLLGLPLGKRLSKNEWVENFFVSLTSIFLTIPPIALLCLLVPSYGMGQKTVWITISLYNLLVVTKFSSTQPIGPIWNLSFVGTFKKLTITNISLSTLAAFFGAGGFGSLISLGLVLNDVPLMLRGAMVVAFFAMAVKWIFEGWEFVLKKDSTNADKSHL